MVSDTVYLDVLYTVFVFVVAGVIGELIIAYIRRAGQRAGTAIVSVRLVRQLIRIAWVGLAALAALTIWGVTSDVLTAFIFGLLGLVISLALQSTLSNMISGIFLLYDGAVRLGDHIEHFAVKGVVVRVALRNTWVRTEAGTIAVVGNTKLADGPTFNADLTLRYEAAARAEGARGTGFMGRLHPPPPTK